jgi:hypothetical protein
MNLVTVYSAINPADAELVQSRLEAAGFDVTMAQELSAVTWGNALAANNALVQVPEDEAAEAREFLASESPPPIP